MHQKQRVDCTPGRRHVVPGPEQVGQTGKPRSRWTARLGKQDQIVAWLKPTTWPSWMSQEQCDNLPDHLRLRELRYPTQRPGLRVQTVTLVTTLLDPHISSLEALAALSLASWRVETNDAHLKTSMGLDVLKCTTVDGVRKELIVLALIYNVVRLVMWEAAKRQQVDVERSSFMDALRWLASADDGEPLPSLVVNPHRPKRYAPRVRTRRPQPYSLMSKPRHVLRNQLLNKSLELT